MQLDRQTSPTAQISLAEITATAKSSLSFVPTFGLLTILQLVPFQCSISVWRLVPLEEYPTAQTLCAEMAATAFSWIPLFGLETTCHCAPFQCSISGCERFPLTKVPTAQASCAETAATPLSSLKFDPGLGLVTMFQAPQVNAAWAAPAVSSMIRTVASPPASMLLFTKGILFLTISCA